MPFRPEIRIRGSDGIPEGLPEIERPERPELVEAWKKGATGFPLVDASMRCLKEAVISAFMQAMPVKHLSLHQL